MKIFILTPKVLPYKIVIQGHLLNAIFLFSLTIISKAYMLFLPGPLLKIILNTVLG